MLRTTIAIQPAGGGEPADLAQLWVAQIRRGAGDLADYVWWLYEPPSPYSSGVDRAGVVTGWNRMQPAAALVARCMAAAFEDPQAFEETLPEPAATVVGRWRAKAPRPQARQAAVDRAMSRSDTASGPTTSDEEPNDSEQET